MENLNTESEGHQDILCFAIQRNVCDTLCLICGSSYHNTVWNLYRLYLYSLTGSFDCSHVGLASESTATFKEELYQYWFMLYTRSGGPLDSSGFEHTYVGEIDEGEVKGLHNWVQTYLEEKAGNLIYNGPIDSCEVSAVIDMKHRCIPI